MKRSLLVCLILLAMTSAALAQMEVPQVNLEPTFICKLAPMDEVNSTFNFTDRSDAETKFKEARYLVQKGDLYIAYNKNTENIEFGYFSADVDIL